MTQSKHAGKVAVVTGASSDMGQEFTRRLATEGADLVLASRHPATEAEQMVKDRSYAVVSRVSQGLAFSDNCLICHE